MKTNHVLEQLDRLIESTMDPASIAIRRQKIAAEERERSRQIDFFTEACHDAMTSILEAVRYPNTSSRRAVKDAMRYLEVAVIAANKINPEDDQP